MARSQATAVRAPAVDLSAAGSAAWLAGTVFMALLVIYFVGLDQGAVSVFGDGTYIHEFMHDARHVLTFPCH